MHKAEVITLKNVYKSFPGVQALSDVSLNFFPGEVHILLGENGAGKSTLAKIIAGIYCKDQGQILFGDKEVNFTKTKQALDAGITMIHQELNLLPDLTVAENIYIGHEFLTKHIKLLDKRLTNSSADVFIKSLNLSLDPKALVAHLSTGEKQLVEIARAVSSNATTILMDEPTSSLSSGEVDKLFNVIRDLKNRKAVIIYVTHRLKEVKEIGDRVTIMRDGKVITTVEAKNINEDKMIYFMVGREIKNYFNKQSNKTDSKIMQVRDLARTPVLKTASFELFKGEILGIAGLIGSGRTEILRTIFGLNDRYEGNIEVFGKEVKFHTASEAIENGFGFLTEDRRAQGVLLDKSVCVNITLPSIHKYKKNLFIDKTRERKVSAQYVQLLGIKTSSVDAEVENLSGGNQQKVILAKWLAADTKILLLDEPTRGIDVGAKSEIYRLMSQYTLDGGSIIMVSSDLPEVLGVSDRIVVMREGVMTGILSREDANEEVIMRLASAESVSA